MGGDRSSISHPSAEATAVLPLLRSENRVGEEMPAGKSLLAAGISLAPQTSSRWPQCIPANLSVVFGAVAALCQPSQIPTVVLLVLDKETNEKFLAKRVEQSSVLQEERVKTGAHLALPKGTASAEKEVESALLTRGPHDDRQLFANEKSRFETVRTVFTAP